MCSTATGLASGTTGGTCVCTWAASRSPAAATIVTVTAENTRILFIGVLSQTPTAPETNNVHAEPWNRHGAGRRTERLLLDFDTRLLPNRDRRVHRLRRHLPQPPPARKLRAVDCHVHDARLR